MVARSGFKQGDIIALSFDPQAGHEQKGFRPALVVSNDLFNRLSRMLMVCPITNSERRNPLQVQLDDRTATTGTILCDQVRTIDPVARSASYIEQAPPEITSEAVDMIIGCVE
jgi:mRNA interferase MazF